MSKKDASRRGRKPGISKGYRQLPSGKYQVRVAGFPSEVVPDELTASLRVAQLRICKRDANLGIESKRTTDERPRSQLYVVR